MATAKAVTMATTRTDRTGDVSRRTLLAGGAIGAGLGTLLGGIGGATAGYVLAGRPSDEPSGVGHDPQAERVLTSAGDLPGFGGETLPCHGTHQAGIVTMPAAHVRYVSYRLRTETDADGVYRMLRLITGDIEALTAGLAPLADPEVELAERPSRLTVTVGVGADLVDRVNPNRRPAWLAPLPSFTRDELGGGYDGGDLLFIVQADDPLPVAHAARMLHRDVDRFAEVAWVQQGFRQARGAEPGGTTMRNLMGQVDGTVNPAPGTDGFDDLMWIAADDGQEWLAGGSAFVLRRIRMELDTWDMVDRPGRESTIGRTLADGAPLNDPHGGEHAPADFEARNELGLRVINPASHIARAHSTDPSERVVRRAVNYDDGHESGLLFGCYQRNPLRQFVPVQARLDEADLLNEWVTHTGSAVFAVLPGFMPGEVLGEALFA